MQFTQNTESQRLTQSSVLGLMHIRLIDCMFFVRCATELRSGQTENTATTTTTKHRGKSVHCVAHSRITEHRFTVIRVLPVQFAPLFVQFLGHAAQVIWGILYLLCDTMYVMFEFYASR